MNTNLQGLRILVTRPRQQADRLCRLIEGQGGLALRFPTLEIQQIGTKSDALLHMLASENIEWLIFISANAVNFAVKANDGKIARLSTPRIAAVGNATAKALQDHGLSVDLVPQKGFNSEALLDTEALQDIHGKRCVIVRGEGGRDVLAQTLRERGAHVEYLEVYRRVMPKSDVSELVELLQDQKLSAITITSGEALQNLLDMLGDQTPLLLPIALVVISERIRQMAKQMGFRRIAVTDGPSDAAILQTLIKIQWGKQWPK